jgi:glucosamine-6-phosphate deaminase
MQKEFRQDNLLVKTYSDRMQMGTAAANDVISKINELLSTQDFVNIIFAAAPSQNEFLAALSVAQLPWNRIRAFHMDEYIGLSADAPQRFGNFLHDRIFSKLPFAEVHYIDGNADEQTSCENYALLLKKYPADIVCMGIGENGHIAFNDPPVANFKDAALVKVVELELPCRQQQVNDGCFAAINDVPLKAITLTMPALMSAAFIFCMVPGSTKATAVYNTLHQNIIEQYPSTILRAHANAVLYIDELSGALLEMQK